MKVRVPGIILPIALAIAFCLRPLLAVAGSVSEEIQVLLADDAHESTHGLATPGVRFFYESRDFTPVWSNRTRLKQLADALGETEFDGLDPRDYSLALIEQALDRQIDSDDASLARFDIQVTHCYLRALLHLHQGKVDPKSLDAHWNIQPQQEGGLALLTAAAEAVRDNRISQAFDYARPRLPIYARLRVALGKLRAIEAGGGWPQVPEGMDLKQGMSDPRVVMLRARLAAGGYLPGGEEDSERYDEAVSKAVALFQSEQYLPETGVLQKATRDALNIPVQSRINQLRVNLERARWAMHEIHDNLVLVDVAGFNLQLYKDGQSVWSSKVQVGQVARQTPIIKSTITHVTFNPAWTVPPTIFRKDILPRVRKDKAYLAANHLRVLDTSGRELSPDSVDWKDPEGITLRQDAGPWGALGRIAIRFSSPYMVYLHETPHVELFAKGQRAFSSGCIRVERPYELAELLLGWNNKQTREMLKTNDTRDVALAKPVPILLLYWTVSLKPGGRIAFKPDTYRKDPPVLASLNEKFAGPAL